MESIQAGIGRHPGWGWKASRLGLEGIQAGIGRHPGWGWKASRLGLEGIQAGIRRHPGWGWKASRLGLEGNQAGVGRHPGWDWKAPRLGLEGLQVASEMKRVIMKKDWEHSNGEACKAVCKDSRLYKLAEYKEHCFWYGTHPDMTTALQSPYREMMRPSLG